MLSDDDFYSAEIDEMKNENPELEEYDRVFRKIKEALTVEIQTTKTKLFDKIHELNDKTEHQFNQLYNSCDKRVRRYFDSKYKKKNHSDSLDDDNDNMQPTKNTKSSDSHTDKDTKNKNKKEKKKSKEEVQQLKTDDTEKESDGNNSNDHEYSDDVVFGFLVGSEEESEFLD